MVFDHDFRRFPELSNSQLNDFGLISPHPQITEDFDAEVVKVHDGDTVTIRTSFRDFDFPLRILDIDAPELSEGGNVARDYLSARILGKTVRVVMDYSNRVGKYGRLLGHILSAGMSVAEEMLSVGLVSPFGFKKESEVPDRLFFVSDKQWF